MGNTGTAKHPCFLGGVYSYNSRDIFLKKNLNTELIHIRASIVPLPEALNPSDKVESTNVLLTHICNSCSVLLTWKQMTFLLKC
jgi:hypothetical protein